MLLDNRPYTFDRVVRMTMSAILGVGLIFLLSYLSDVLVPFAIAFLLAYLLNPIVGKLQDWGVRSRLLAVLLTLVLTGVFVGIACWLIVPLIIGQITHMGVLLGVLAKDKKLPEAAAEYISQDTWQNVLAFLDSSKVHEYLKSDTFLDMLKTAGSKILPIGRGLVTGVVSTVLVLVGLGVVLLYTVFLMLDFQKVRKDWQALIPHQYRQTVVAFVQDFDAGMNRYFRAQATIASLVGVIYAIGFQIIGLPMGILLGLLIAILGMVPYLRVLSLLPVVTLALAKSLDTGQSFWMIMIGVLIVYAVAEAADGTLLTPRIMGDATGLSPALIILSLSVWGKLLGLLGLLIALPMTCLLLAYYRRIIAAQTVQDVDEKAALPIVPTTASAATSQTCICTAPQKPTEGETPKK